MAITFDEVNVDVREPAAPAPAAPAAHTAPGGPELDERVEHLLRICSERELRLRAD